jgi:peroxiredoxin
MERKGGMGLAAIVAVAALIFFQWDRTVGRAAPDFTLDQAYGGRVDLSAYRGRSVLLVFWTTSCSICRHELPLLDRLNTEFRARGVEILAVNIRDLDGARQFMGDQHLRLTNLIDADGTTAERYGVSGVPKLVLVGPDGKVRRTAAGWQGEGTLREWLAGV